MTKAKSKKTTKSRKAKKAKARSLPSLKTIGWVFGGCALASAVGLGALLVDYRTLDEKAVVAGREAVRAAGFKVDHLEISGSARFSSEQLAQIAKIAPETSIFGQDLDEMRVRLEAQTWIKSARVARKLPNVLALHVEEYQPVARWQINRKIHLIDADGTPFLAVGKKDYRALPLVVGPGAQVAAQKLNKLIADYPALEMRLVAATRIGTRRWDLSFESGAVVKMPEDGLAEKLKYLDSAQAERKILDGGFLRIDMRMDQLIAVSATPDKPVKKIIGTPS